jgi:2-polyprenyl-3-methyl-5-hydroxy-6-metoxy-1,4-benzoquinol methylase
MSQLSTTDHLLELPAARVTDAGRPATYLFDHARHPRRPALLEDVRLAAARLASKLTALELGELPISPYIRRHLRLKCGAIEAYLQLYSFILSWSLANNREPLNRVTFCDYGAGSGILAMLAKELGIGTVIYNDIYDVSCHDAALVAERIGCKADWYVHGDFDELVSFLEVHGIALSSVASYDVIEHVYDTPAFLARLPQVVTGSVMMASGANPFNLITRWRLMKLHGTFERQDRKPRDGQKERDTTRSHLGIRREIIGQMPISLAEADVETLARRTRGLKRADIETAVERFVINGELPRPTHPTNTCDPYTGNWQERLMDPFSLANALRLGGCADARVLAGYHGCRASHPARRLAKSAINLAIRAAGPIGLAAAPFYMVCGWKEPFAR